MKCNEGMNEDEKVRKSGLKIIKKEETSNDGMKEAQVNEMSLEMDAMRKEGRVIKGRPVQESFAPNTSGIDRSTRRLHIGKELTCKNKREYEK